MSRLLKNREQGGFTLLELLMVVIIIAILVSIALPQYFRATERARTGQVMSLLASLRGSEMRFKAQDPGNAYTVALANLDLALPSAMPGGWALPTVTGAGVGANVQSLRVGGINGGASLGVDLDSGAMCAGTAAAAADWGVAGPAGC